MTTSLATLRRHPQPAPAQFLGAHPGCWIQYYDDTAGRDPGKALSAATFDPAVAARKQKEKCAVGFSLQPFRKARIKEELLCLRNLGVDVDLVPAADRGRLSDAEIDRRKDEYLSRCLLPFPLKPHWLIETRHGFHAIFRVQPQRSPLGVRDAADLNARLVRVLLGDERAMLLTQLLRVPGTWQVKDPRGPCLCRLLIDNASVIPPYSLGAIRGLLDAWGVFYPAETKDDPSRGTERPQAWRAGLAGVLEGRRNATAASLVGAILVRLPEDLWETAGWGGLLEWNRRNASPLPQRELKAVFESIAKREGARRAAQRRTPTGTPVEPVPPPPER
jgi:hypothetical protein